MLSELILVNTTKLLEKWTKYNITEEVYRLNQFLMNNKYQNLNIQAIELRVIYEKK